MTRPAALTAVDALGVLLLAVGSASKLVGGYHLERFRAASKAAVFNAVLRHKSFHVVHIFRNTSTSAVRWLSGRKRRFAKPLYGLKPVPRVRIPASPPVARSRLVLPVGRLQASATRVPPPSARIPASPPRPHSIAERIAAVRNPRVASRPTILPPCSKASGIITSESIVNIAPAANALAYRPSAAGIAWTIM